MRKHRPWVFVVGQLVGGNGQSAVALAAGREPTGTSTAGRYRTARAVPLLC